MSVCACLRACECVRVASCARLVIASEVSELAVKKADYFFLVCLSSCVGVF